LDIDLQGIQTIKKRWDPKRGAIPKFIQIVPPSFNILKSRLVGRGDTNEEAIKKRLETARNELSHTLDEDLFDYIITNDVIEKAVHELALAINDSQKI